MVLYPFRKRKIAMHVFNSFQAVYDANATPVGVASGMSVFNGQQERDKVKKLLAEIPYCDEQMATAKWQDLTPLMIGELEEINTKFTDPSSEIQRQEAVTCVQWVNEVVELLEQQGKSLADFITQDFGLNPS